MHKLDTNELFAKNIIYLRTKNNLTQLELAEKLNYSDKAVSKWERGESIPDVVVLKQIADLFGVTVDYLLEEVHPLKSTMQNMPRQLKKNRALITGLACMLVFLIATVGFVILSLTTQITRLWLLYIYAIPICAVLLIVFNSVWGKKKRNFFFISLLMWGLLLSVYLTIGIYANWLIFVMGIPGQVIIVMWSGIKARLLNKK